MRVKFLLTKGLMCGILCKVNYSTPSGGSHMFEKDMTFTVLLDTYGSLLSDRKREMLEYYYNEDYSLAEISSLTGISRQGVRDSIKKSEDRIRLLDSELKLVAKNEAIRKASEELHALLSETSETPNADFCTRLNEIARVLDSADGTAG